MFYSVFTCSSRRRFSGFLTAICILLISVVNAWILDSNVPLLLVISWTWCWVSVILSLVSSSHLTISRRWSAALLFLWILISLRCALWNNRLEMFVTLSWHKQSGCHHFAQIYLNSFLRIKIIFHINLFFSFLNQVLL